MTEQPMETDMTCLTDLVGYGLDTAQRSVLFMDIIRKRVKSAGLTDYHVFLGFKPIKYRSNAVTGAFSIAVTYHFEELICSRTSALRGSAFNAPMTGNAVPFRSIH